MITFFLRFPDETTAQQVLTTANIYVPSNGINQGYYRQADIGWAFDPIGTITKGGTLDPETGEELEPPTVLEGWHANYAGNELPEALSGFVVFPSSPVRVFAGLN